MTYFPCIWYSCFLFLLWGLVNYVVCIKSCQFIVANVHSLFPDLPFTWIPVLTWCAPSHIVFRGRCFLVSFSISCAILARVSGMTLCPYDQQYPFGSIFETYFSSLFLVFFKCILFCAPFFLFHAGSGLQWWMLESCWTLSMFFWLELSGR